MPRLFTLVVAVLAALPVFGQIYGSPSAGLTTVTVDFFLLDRNSVDEKDETFDADLCLEFEWDDPRLAHDGSEEQLFADAAVDEKLTSMWWPQIGYVNTSEPTVTNQSLEVVPSGHVKYTVGMTSTFRTGLDLRRFPFDSQVLTVRLQSFLYDVGRVRLVPATQPPGWEHDGTDLPDRPAGLHRDAFRDQGSLAVVAGMILR